MATDLVAECRMANTEGKLYTVVIHEGSETLAFLRAANIKEAWQMAKEGRYDLDPGSALSLRPKVKKVMLSDLAAKQINPIWGY